MTQVEQNISCPICKTSMCINELKLTCKKNHSFDIAKQGYVNLLNRAMKTNYDKNLFISRHKLIANSTFFTPLHEKLMEVVLEGLQTSKISLLDAGSGEGSHLHKIYELLNIENEKISAVGIDIAKDGILQAAKYYENQIWFVADLANIPFKEQTFNVILNILSPANYDEFTRVLKQDGVAIKVVPQKDYLKQIREFNDEQHNHKSIYSNEQTVELFHTHFKAVKKIRLRYDVTLNDQDLIFLLQMTPLTWNWSKERINDCKKSGIRTITVDFDILVGRKKE